MFANMDYPVDDQSFKENVSNEVVGQLRRLSSHPSIVVYCGNSEVEQQAAMLGVSRELWTNEWFSKCLPALCNEHHPGTAYVPSTPTGGVLPFHPSSGVSHFYGVGAYLRSTAELRQTDVRFTSECLGFANLPEPETIDAITNSMNPVMHHPQWKRRIPRDTGAGWDFEDVRDHYLKQTYGYDPVPLRSSETQRYLELSRVVTGDMMAQTFSEWRSGHSRNRGGLVWFFKDLWPAAGWGIVDSFSVPKAAYYFLKRTWRSRQILLTDEGLNGMHVHVVNETPDRLRGFVEMTLLKEPNIVIARKEVPCEIDLRGQALWNAEEILGGFYDASYAYRFGPQHHDLVIATLFDADHQILGEAFHCVRRRESMITPANIKTIVEVRDDSEYRLTVVSDRFLHNLRLYAKGFLPDDNYFHLVPNREKQIRFKSTDDMTKKFEVEIEALNLEIPITASFSGHQK